MKTQTSKTHKYVLILLSCGAVALITSCANGPKKQCAENRRDHIPFITCQPVDQLVLQDQPATLSVKAQGRGLVYAWYKSKAANGTDAFDLIPGENNSSLKIAHVGKADVRFYYCTITSTDNVDGKMGTAETRTAAIGMVPTAAMGNFIPCDWPYTSGSPSTICNPPQQYVAYDQFPTNEVPTASGTVTCWVKDLTTGNILSNNDYYMYWFHNVLNNGYMTAQGDGQTFKMAVTGGWSYHFTAYFKANHVPPAGDTLELQGTFQ